MNVHVSPMLQWHCRMSRHPCCMTHTVVLHIRRYWCPAGLFPLLHRTVQNRNQSRKATPESRALLLQASNYFSFLVMWIQIQRSLHSLNLVVLTFNTKHPATKNLHNLIPKSCFQFWKLRCSSKTWLIFLWLIEGFGTPAMNSRRLCSAGLVSS